MLNKMNTCGFNFFTFYYFFILSIYYQTLFEPTLAKKKKKKVWTLRKIEIKTECCDLQKRIKT